MKVFSNSKHCLYKFGESKKLITTLWNFFCDGLIDIVSYLPFFIIGLFCNFFFMCDIKGRYPLSGFHPIALKFQTFPR